MDTETPHYVGIAGENLRRLRNNEYPGRLIIAGLSPDCCSYIQIFAITVRSEYNQNRVLTDFGNGEVRTEPADPKKMRETTNIIYPAMLENNDMNVVSNGTHTRDIAANTSTRYSMATVLSGWHYEEDSANTPRIAAVHRRSGTSAILELGIISASVVGSTERRIFQYQNLVPGMGYCIHTYDRNGEPPPSFSQLPYLVPIPEKGAAEFYWDVLNPNFRVSLAMKTICIGTGESTVEIINRHQKVSV